MATPHLGHVPYNAIAGDNANLRQEGTAPWCAMFQIASADVYDDYVICRGFDPRILKFIDYAEGDSDKPGVSVAKPFGKRKPDTYEVGEVYPAFLPTQGNAGFADFRQVVYTPPSPTAVKWRVGQNPGVSVGGLDGGQPENLAGEIGILYDHNGKVVNWLLIDSNGGVDHYLFTMLEDMGMSDGAAEIRTMDDAEQVEASADVVNTLGDFSYLVNTNRGICVKVNGIYYAIHPEDDQDGGVVFTLTSDLADTVSATATATVLVTGVNGVPVSSSITVYNTGRKKSWTGAVGWAVLVGNQFWVAEVNQYPIRSVVTFNADTHTFSPVATYQGKVADQDTISVSAMDATTPYPFSFVPSPFPTITNPYNLIGLSGDKGLVTYNENSDEFQLVAVYPQEKRRVAFKLTEDMTTVTITDTDKFLPTETREFTSGEMPFLPSPPTDSIYDPMKLVIDGKEDDLGIVEYSYRAERWEITSFRRRDFGRIEFTITEATTVSDSSSPYAGMRKLTVTVVGPSCNRTAMLGETGVFVYEHDPQCLTTDETDEALVDRKGWAFEGIFQDQGTGASPGDATPCHWVLDGLCCP